MDAIEINKLTQKQRVDVALDHLYELRDLNKYESCVLMAYACRKQFGVLKTAKILHGLDIKNFKI